jgi:N-acetylglutamate synthase-like GNAT family acetyltransferase
MICKYNDAPSVIELIGSFAMDRSVIKELGEAVVFDEFDTFYIKEMDSKVVAFAAITGKAFIKYIYVDRNKRGLGLFSDLLKAIEKDHQGLLIKAVSTKMALPMYLAKGYTLTKSFSNYFKIQKQNG